MSTPMITRESTRSGGPAPSCHQDAAGSPVLGLVLAGPGCGFSEESMPRCESTALETESFPECPPGPVATLASRLVWSASMRAKMTFDSRRFRTRRAIIDGMPPALCRS